MRELLPIIIGHRYRKGFVCKPSNYKNDKLLDTMARKDEYNAKYGTHYSYGQYMAAKEHGWLKHDWSEFEDDNKTTQAVSET